MAIFDNPFALLGDEDDGAGIAVLIDRMAAAEQKKKEAEEVEKKKTKAEEEEKKALSKPGSVRARGAGVHGRSNSDFDGRRGPVREYNRVQWNFGNGKQSNYNVNQHNNRYVLKEKETEVRENGFNFNKNKYENGSNNEGRVYVRRGDYGNVERQRFDGQNGGKNNRRNDQRNQFKNNKGKHNVGNGDNVNNDIDASAREIHETAEIPKHVEPEKVLSEQEKKRLEGVKLKREEFERKDHERREQARKDREEDEKKLTLRQYEEQLQQKRKELVEKLKKFEEGRGISEGLKTEGRKLLIEKEAKVIWKRKEEVFMKLKSEKENLKRRDSLEKDDRVRKGTIIPNFRFRKPERNHVGGNGQDRGQDNRNSIDYRVGLSAHVPESKPDPKPMSKLAPRFEDCLQFPALRGAPSTRIPVKP